MTLILQTFHNHLWALAFLIIGVIGTTYVDDIVLLDRLILLSIFLSAVYCRKNEDILTALLIIFIGQLVYELFGSLNNSGYLWQVFSYLLAGIAVWRSEGDFWRLPVFILFILSLGAEIYWYINNINSPAIAWYWVTISTCLLQRYHLIMRSVNMTICFNRPSKETDLDYSLSSYCALPIIVELANLTEYIARHFIGLNSYFVYNSYPWIQQLSAMLLIVVTLVFSYQVESKRRLSA